MPVLAAFQEMSQRCGKSIASQATCELNLSVLQTDADDRPFEPPRILSSEILWNPFDDIEPRTTPEEREFEAAQKRWLFSSIPRPSQLNVQLPEFCLT